MSTPDSSHDQDHASHGHDEQLPEEPKTPFWLTALGVALLVSGGLGYLMFHEPTVEEAEPDTAATAEAEPEKAPPPAATPARPPRRGPKGLPPGIGSGRRPLPDLRRLRMQKPPAGH